MKEITDAEVRIAKIIDDVTGMDVGEMTLVSSQIYARAETKQKTRPRYVEKSGCRNTHV